MELFQHGKLVESSVAKLASNKLVIPFFILSKNIRKMFQNVVYSNFYIKCSAFLSLKTNETKLR